MLSVLASGLLSRGRLHLLKAVRFEYFTLPSHLRGIVSLIRPETHFKVTPKDGIDEGGLSWVRFNRALAGLIALLTAAIVWRVLAQFAGLLPTHHLRPAVLAVLLSLGLFELARLLDAAISLSRHRQLRGAYRFATNLRGELGGRPCAVRNLSASGCAISVDGVTELADEPNLDLDLGALGVHRFVLEHARYAQSGVAGTHVHGRIRPLDGSARNALAVALFVLTFVSKSWRISARRHLLHSCAVLTGLPSLKINGSGSAKVPAFDSS